MRSLEMLFEVFGVPRSGNPAVDYHSLALFLAREYVPGFRVVDADYSRGRPSTHSPTNLIRLLTDLEVVKRRMKLTGSSASDAKALRIVVSTRDRHFRRVAEFLLTRQGMSAEFERDTDAAVELAERTRPDVVLLDGSQSLASVARGLNRLSVLDPSIRVVVVGDEVFETPKTLSVLPKWGSFAEILAAIQVDRPGVEET